MVGGKQERKAEYIQKRTVSYPFKLWTKNQQLALRLVRGDEKNTTHVLWTLVLFSKFERGKVL